MNKREYLRSLGFEVGSRGRFSAEMQEALKDFDDSTPIEEPVPKVPNTPKRTDGIKLYKATLNDGIVIKFDYCPSCKESVVYCHCVTPLPPKWLRESVASWSAME